MIAEASPDDLDPEAFAAGSMGPKVAAAVDFRPVRSSKAVIGSLDDMTALVEHRAGTLIAAHCSGITYGRQRLLLGPETAGGSAEKT